MKSERYKKIVEENLIREKEAPYNFCDRWCERCQLETQVRCRLYLDELEQEITCIAHGKELDDPEIIEEVMQWQYNDAELWLDIFDDEGLCLDEEEDSSEERTAPIMEKSLADGALGATAERYRQKAQALLKRFFYGKKIKNPQLFESFEILDWYHALLPVKLRRALSGYQESVFSEDVFLCDTVAQFSICKRAINLSIEALQTIKKQIRTPSLLVIQLTALLHNINSRIEVLEEQI